MGYQISLEVFEGPLHLLLHLIEKEEMEISAISLTRIIQQYLEYLQGMEELDFQTAASFLYVTMELMDLKRRLLLPEEKREILEKEKDRDLVETLKEYQSFRQVADHLREIREDQILLYCPEGHLPGSQSSSLLTAPSLEALKEAFWEVLVERRKKEGKKVSYPLQETLTIKGQMNFIRERLKSGRLSFYYLCQGLGILDFIVTFLSLLELVRNQEVGIIQEREGRDLFIYGKG